VIWIPAAADILLVLVKHDLVPHTWRTPLCELLTGQRTFAGIQTFITPAFLAGTALCVLGCRFRSAAYAALGRHFTFELALARDQPLVTTYPYSVVRHPAYIGGFVGALGADLALYAARGGWVREALVPWAPRAVAGVGLGALVGLQVLMIAGLSARVPGEDRIMREHFGREWEEWARRVPYKLIPGVY
jgi:protein-S-isoprenylcysteine O-methyltransferase Ste14